MALVAGRRGAKEGEGHRARKDRGRGAGKRFLRCVTPVDVMMGRTSGIWRGIYDCVSQRELRMAKQEQLWGYSTTRSDCTTRIRYQSYIFTHDSDTHDTGE